MCAFGTVFNINMFKIQNVLYSFGGNDMQGGMITLLSNSKQNNQAASGNAKQTKRLKNKSGKENHSFGESEPPPKRRCK